MCLFVDGPLQEYDIWSTNKEATQKSRMMQSEEDWVVEDSCLEGDNQKQTHCKTEKRREAKNIYSQKMWLRPAALGH